MGAQSVDRRESPPPDSYAAVHHRQADHGRSELLGCRVCRSRAWQYSLLNRLFDLLPNLLASNLKVELGLQIQPKLRAGAEISRESQGHLSRDHLRRRTISLTVGADTLRSFATLYAVNFKGSMKS